MQQNLTWINRRDVERIATVQLLLQSAETAFRALSSGAINAPLRNIIRLAGGNLFGVMPAEAVGQGVFGAKLVSLCPDNAMHGRPVIQGLVALFDGRTGEPTAVVDGASLTLLRTAAASAVATRLLAREDADTLGLFGTGAQAAAHIEAICAVRRIRTITVWGRNPDRARQFAELAAERASIPVHATEVAEEVASASIVCTATSSPDPVVKGEWLLPGTHVNLIGAHSPTTREITTSGLARAKLYVDFLGSALAEAGDILIPIGEGAVSQDHIIGEIGQLLEGIITGRGDPDNITIFKSVGHVAQDLVAANAIMQAIAEGQV